MIGKLMRSLMPTRRYALTRQQERMLMYAHSREAAAGFAEGALRVPRIDIKDVVHFTDRPSDSPPYVFDPGGSGS